MSPDGTSLWSTSKVFGYAYIGAAGDNATYVIDTVTLKEVARIPVVQVSKRNATILMAIDQNPIGIGIICSLQFRFATYPILRQDEPVAW